VLITPTTSPLVASSSGEPELPWTIPLQSNGMTSYQLHGPSTSRGTRSPAEQLERRRNCSAAGICATGTPTLSTWVPASGMEARRSGCTPLASSAARVDSRRTTARSTPFIELQATRAILTFTALPAVSTKWLKVIAPSLSSPSLVAYALRSKQWPLVRAYAGALCAGVSRRNAVQVLAALSCPMPLYLAFWPESFRSSSVPAVGTPPSDSPRVHTSARATPIPTRAAPSRSTSARLTGNGLAGRLIDARS